jgi:hypothetical protein
LVEPPEYPDTADFTPFHVLEHAFDSPEATTGKDGGVLTGR